MTVTTHPSPHTVAVSVLASVVPDDAVRTAWARVFLDSIRVAAAVSPECWSLTLHDSWIRLNVGQIALLELWRDVGVVYARAPVPIDDTSVMRRDPHHRYRAVRETTDRWLVQHESIARLPSVLLEQHRSLITLAARSKKVSPFRRSHSPELYNALQGLVEMATTMVLPEEVGDGQFNEGAVRAITVNAYERNPAAREACIAHHGARCAVCAMDFGSVYGPDAAGYIHVHHLRPLSQIGTSYLVDPINDLRPVCPNCHAVIHLGGITRTLEDVRALLASSRSELTIVEADERSKDGACSARASI